MGGGAEIFVCEVTIRSDRNGEITQKNNYVYLIVQISYLNLVILSLYLAALFVKIFSGIPRRVANFGEISPKSYQLLSNLVAISSLNELYKYHFGCWQPSAGNSSIGNNPAIGLPPDSIYTIPTLPSLA